MLNPSSDARTDRSQRIFHCDLFQGIAPECCVSCHEDWNQGLTPYDPVERELPDGRKVEVCCAVSHWLDGVTAEDWTRMKIAAHNLGMPMPEYCWCCQDWHTSPYYTPKTIKALKSMREVAAAVQHLREQNKDHVALDSDARTILLLLQTQGYRLLAQRIENYSPLLQRIQPVEDRALFPRLLVFHESDLEANKQVIEACETLCSPEQD